MRIVFLGSGEFALAQLEALVAASQAPVLVVTQPPRRRRRRGAAEPTPVQRHAEQAGIPVFAPASVNAPDAIERLRAASADLFAVAEYGQILSREMLDLPPLGAINVHGSLLPRWRGATPVEAAILAGDEVTGVTIQRMVRALDAGPVLATASTAIGEDEERGELRRRLGALGAGLLVDVVASFARGEPPEAVAQNDAEATFCRRISREDTAVDWARPAEEIARLVRALAPKPAARTSLLREPPLDVALRRAAPVSGAAPAGEVAGIGEQGILVGTGLGLLEIREVVPAARRAMSGKDFANGFHLRPGERFGGSA